MLLKAKTTISISSELLAHLDQEAKRTHKNRSLLIEEALKVWRQFQIEKEMIAGYQAMASEDSQTADAHSVLFHEVSHD